MRLLMAGMIWAAALGTWASPCAVDADCDDGLACTGLETCGYDGICRPGIGLCGPPTQAIETRAWASSSYSQGYLPTKAIDGDPGVTSSWCSADGDPNPALHVEWVYPARISEIRIHNAWLTHDFQSGRFELRNAAGGLLYDSGSVLLTAGAIVHPVVPAVGGVRRLSFIGETWRSDDPCISEIEVRADAPCSVDADCAFASPCIAVGICGADKQCTATAPRCRNLALDYEAVVASSFYSAGYWPEQVADGSAATSNSWCSAADDTAPEIALTLPNTHAISLVRLSNGWLLNNFESIDLRFEDEQGVSVLEEQDIPVDEGQRTFALEQQVPRAHKVVLEGVSFDQGPCIGELELHSEYCFIEIAGHSPMSWRFRPATPEPDYEMRYGLLSEMRADGNFERAACLGRYQGGTAEELLPDPPLGDAFYLIARGFNVCAAEQFGLSRVSPDPRAVMEKEPACIP